MKTAELEEYRAYTTPAELHKAVNTLHGMVEGMSADGTVSDIEMQELTHWCSIHANLRHRHPFKEILPVIESALEDGQIDAEEREDILWLCGNYAADTEYYDIITSSIQYLSGLIHGIMADGVLCDNEIMRLKSWLDDNDYLQGTYPFDELYSITYSILADGEISENERSTAMAFLSNLIEFKDSYNLAEPDFEKLREKYSVDGICAFCPDVTFDGKLFCFTGASYKCTREEIFNQIEAHGGLCRSGVSNKTDYLVVGNAGNPCWAYSCYGRKIEKAISLRKDGCKVQIINETDFWDAIEE